jgi:hypothetical protein
VNSLHYREVDKVKYLGGGLHRCTNHPSRFFWIIPERLFHQLWRKELHCIAVKSPGDRGYAYQLLLSARDSRLHVRLIVQGTKYGAPKEGTVYVMGNEFSFSSISEAGFEQVGTRFILDCDLGRFGYEVCSDPDDRYGRENLILMFDILGIQ